MYDPNFANQHTLLHLKCPNFQIETIERFIAYVETLCIELDELPTDADLFKTYFVTGNQSVRALDLLIATLLVFLIDALRFYGIGLLRKLHGFKIRTTERRGTLFCRI